MPNAINSIVAASLTALSLSGCHKTAQGDQNALTETNIPADAQYEALPPDESTGTPADQLSNGDDNADVSDLDLNSADGNGN